MEVGLLGARLVLAAVFAVAAIGKLADLPGSRRSLMDFGLPLPAARAAGIALPLVELAIAVALVPTASAHWAALGASALLLAFCGGIARALGRGKEPDCHCFGRIRSRPVGLGTLLRNALLLALAVSVTILGWDDAGVSATAWVSDLSAGEVIAVGGAAVFALVTALHVSFSYQLFKQNGRLVARIEALEQGGARPRQGLPVGDPAPPFWLPNLDGRFVGLEELVADGPVQLVFSDARCDTCDPALAKVGRLHRDGSSPRVVVIGSGSVEENRNKARRHGLTSVLVQDEHEVAGAFAVGRVPAVVSVGSDGRIAAPLAAGPDAVLAVLPEPKPPQLVVEGSGR